MSQSQSRSQILRGSILLFAALVIYLWARDHSPHMGFGQMLMRLDSYILNPPIYNSVLLICVLLSAAGIVNLVRGFRPDAPTEVKPSDGVS
jgi:hypothetical protein